MKNVLLLGLGVSNIAVANYLTQQGLSYSIYDENTVDHPDTIESLDTIDLNRIDTVIASPGFDPNGELIQRCIQAGCKVINDIALFANLALAPIIAITGTNGKSTTATLLHQMLLACGKKTLLGGNIGIAAMSLLNDPTPDFYVLEVSSFQIELAPSLKPQVGICTNITPDHLERHGNFAQYAAIKESLLLNANIQIHDTQTEYQNTFSHAISFGEQPADFYIDDAALYHREERLIAQSELSQPQYHFSLNALAALACINALKIDITPAITLLKDFKGLDHRTQPVPSKDGLVWVNDSKGTNVGACIAAVKSYYQTGRQLILLLGGVGKDQDFQCLGQAIAPFVAHCVVFGHDKHIISQALQNSFSLCDNLEEAIEKSKKIAHTGDCILLSPACASFDQFKNFAERGEYFVKMIG